MGYTNVGIKLSVKSAVKPEGWSPAVTDTFTDYIFSTKQMTFEVLKSNVEESTESDTMDSLLGDATYGVLKLAETEMSTMLDVTNDILYWIHIKYININLDPTDASSDLYKDVAATYIVKAVMYVKLDPGT